jgi:hypothetical protein
MIFLRLFARRSRQRSKGVPLSQLRRQWSTQGCTRVGDRSHDGHGGGSSLHLWYVHQGDIQDGHFFSLVWEAQLWGLGYEDSRAPWGSTLDWNSVGRHGELCLQFGSFTLYWDGRHGWCQVSTIGKRGEDWTAGRYYIEAEGQEEVTWGGQW